MQSYNFKIKDYGNGNFKVFSYNYHITKGFDKINSNYVNSNNDNKDDIIKKSLYRSRSKIFDYCYCNSWDWFGTFTLSSKKVDRYDYDLCCKKIKGFFDRIRRTNNNLKYIVVPEQHKDGAYHFHCLISDINNELFSISGHKDSKGRDIYNLNSYKLGFTNFTIVDDSDKVSSYIVKYITKDICKALKNRKKYFCSRNLNLPIEYNFDFDNDDKNYFKNKYNLNVINKLIIDCSVSPTFVSSSVLYQLKI